MRNQALKAASEALWTVQATCPLLSKKALKQIEDMRITLYHLQNLCK